MANGRERVKEVIIVEGRYDKAAVLAAVDAPVLETAGFGVFSDGEKLALLRRIEAERGLIIMTDPDGAGFVIRNFLKGALGPNVKHAYIPDIEGKEHRKKRSSKEGKLGVEGMSRDTIIAALKRCGATFEGEPAPVTGGEITKADMYALGLSGREDSAMRRDALKKALGLPSRLSANGLLEVLNVITTRDGLKATVDRL